VENVALNVRYGVLTVSSRQIDDFLGVGHVKASSMCINETYSKVRIG
jgi:hypothetical protein